MELENIVIQVIIKHGSKSFKFNVHNFSVIPDSVSEFFIYSYLHCNFFLIEIKKFEKVNI